MYIAYSCYNSKKEKRLLLFIYFLFFSLTFRRETDETEEDNIIYSSTRESKV